ncbi:MAG: type II toxin-antitoxin system HicB family antitoxin [Betaproteobacteria bacterium]|nr:type II toxin-antitoxin system HicB family antitoxin [Betaproteobacteria bacterium]
MRNLDDYPFEIRPLTEEEGGGFLISYPDFNVCISDGETIEEAISNGRDALQGTINALEESGHSIPAPNSGGAASGKFVTRLPRSLHAALSARARMEGVSLNMLVLSFIAEGIGRMKRHAP